MTILPRMNTLQRFKQRPFEHAVALIMLITGIVTILSGGGVIATHLTPIVEMLWSGLNLAGGVLVLTGLHWRGTPVMARAIESVGWYSESVTLLATVTALIYFAGWGLALGLLDELALVLAMTFRAWFLHDEKRAERVAIAFLRRERQEGDE